MGMDYLVFIARLLLAGTFVVAGAGKLADLPGSRKAIVSFGLPAAVSRPFGLALPLAELMAAAGLLPVFPARIGGIAALALLLLFIAGICANLVQGRAPDCHCFGQIRSEPIGWRTLARNLALAAVAGFVIWQGQRFPDPALSVWAALGLIGLAALALRSPKSQAASQPLDLPVGSPAPDFQVESLEGERTALVDLLAPGRPLLLLFTHPDCGPCQSLMPDIARWQRSHDEQLNIAILSEGSVEDNRSKREEHGLSTVLIQKKREVAEAYQTRGTPAAVVVREDGTVGSQLAHGPGPIWELMARTLGMTATNVVVNLADSGLPVGTEAPEFRLRRPEGELVGLGDLLRGGKPVVLLFVNPDWPPSVGLMADVARWQREQQFLLERVVAGNGEIFEAYGVRGTPAAAVVRPDGTIGSPLALGAGAIRDLVNSLNVAGAAA